MVEYYPNREKEYEDWCTEHVGGYVFNHAGGSTGNVLHKVGCQHLTVPSRIGTYTTRYPKYCAGDITVLKVYLLAEQILYVVLKRLLEVLCQNSEPMSFPPPSYNNLFY
jgi:hypothetical protein